jgi:hypothetical protein
MEYTLTFSPIHFIFSTEYEHAVHNPPGRNRKGIACGFLTARVQVYACEMKVFACWLFDVISNLCRISYEIRKNQKIDEVKVANLSELCICVTYFIVPIGINVIIHT